MIMLPRRSISRVTIQEIQESGARSRQDDVAIEEPLEIRISFEVAGKRVNKSISITMRTPGHDFELAAGFLLSEGIVQSGEEIERVTYCMGPDKARQQYNV